MTSRLQERTLARSQGFKDGDSQRDSAVYLVDHTAYVDVVGDTSQGSSPAFVVRGLNNSNNVPTEVFRINKDGTPSFPSSVTLNISLLDRGGWLFNVKANGAVSDGVTVNTTIQTTINNCSVVGGGTVGFPGHGTYVTDNLQVPANVTLLGDGATIKAKAGLVGELITPQGDNVILRGLGIDGNASTNTGVGFGTTTSGFTMDRCNVSSCHYGIQAGNAQSNVRVQNSTFTTCNAVCVTFQAGCTGAKILDNDLHDASGGGISFNGSLAGDNSDILIDGNKVRNIAVLPIECQYGLRVTVTKNIISGSGTNGVSVGPCTRAVITSNEIYDQSNYGVECATGASGLTNSTYTVSSNTIGACGLGIIADQVTGMTLGLNTIYATTVSDAVRFTGCNTVTLGVNTLIDPKTNAISVLSDSNGNPCVGVHAVGNTIAFRAARTNAPCAINIGTSNRTVFETNEIEVATDVADDSLFFLGPVIFTGVPNDATVRNNTIISTLNVAHHSAIRIQAGVTAAGLHVLRNRIKNFEEGINTNSDSSTDVVIEDNSVLGCTIPYTINAAHQPVAAIGVPGKLLITTGVPSNSLGNNGDFALRGDGTEAGHTLLYHKEGGSWVTTAA